MDLKHVVLIIGIVLLVGTATAAGGPADVGITVQYTKTLTDTPLAFSGTATGATSWSWDFGDGGTATGRNVQYTFASEGDYFVTLTAINASGSATVGRTITVVDTVFTQNGDTWEYLQQTPQQQVGSRYGHAALVYNDKMWVIGGHSGAGYANDVWWSTDGVTWTRATANAGWTARHSHTATVHNGKMWVIGGTVGGNAYKNDVWWSTDGVTWTQATENAGWDPRYQHASVAYDGKLWVFGGWGTTAPLTKNDVWWSADGATWIQATASAAWGTRNAHTAEVYDGKMWVIGGSGRNDVWWSTNGLEWTRATGSIHWGLPSGHATVIYDNKIFAFGGLTKNEVWWTTDGATWTQTSANAEWGRRTNHDVIVYKNTMWLMGGYYGTAIYGDVWKSAVSSSSAIQYPPTVIRDSATSFSTPMSVYDMASYQWQFGDGATATGSNPTHMYTEPGTYTVTLTTPGEINGLQAIYKSQVTVAAGEGLTAMFTATPMSGTPPTTVQFTDASIGNPTSWAWNFGDGSATSNDQNPAHMYTKIGTYMVSLYVENAEDSDWEVKENYISVSSFPTMIDRGTMPSRVKENYISVSSFPPVVASPTYNTTIHYDMANGTYLQYWLFNVTTFGDLPVYGFGYGIMAPLMNVWGYWVFVIFWLAYLFIVWLRTSDVGLPIIIGLLTAGVWGIFFPPEAIQFAYLMFGLSIAALLTKLAIEYI